MISLKQAKWLLVGGAVAYVWNYSRGAARRARSAQQEDALQSFDGVPELTGVPLGYDALSQEDIDAAEDLANLESEISADGDDSLVLSGDMDQMAAETDSGELYGLHTPRAMNNELMDDDRSMENGQTWLEALETSAAEDGAEPESDLNIIDDEDMLEGTHASMGGDRPIADLGSAGPRGL